MTCLHSHENNFFLFFLEQTKNINDKQTPTFAAKVSCEAMVTIYIWSPYIFGLYVYDANSINQHNAIR